MMNEFNFEGKIETSNFEHFQSRFNSISKRIIRCGGSTSIEVGEVEEMTQTLYTVGLHNALHNVGKRVLHVVPVSIHTEQPQTDWEVVARIDHGEKANIVRSFGEHTAKKEYFTVCPHCDHCHINRYRKVTYIVKRGEEEKQVGLSCMTEYTRIPAGGLQSCFELEDLILQDNTPTSTEYHHEHGYLVEDVLALSYDVFSRQGYVKSGEPNSNKSELTKALYNDMPTATAKEWASVTAEKLLHMDIDTAEKYFLGNACASAQNGIVEPYALGFLAYVPQAFRRMEDDAQTAQKNASCTAYFGEVGKRYDIAVTNAEHITTLYGAYGETYVYKFTDSDGHVFVWYASNSINIENAHTIKGTVKAYKEFKGEKQTIITRCKVA